MPESGNQPSPTTKTTMRMSASQKLGMELSARPMELTMPSSGRPRRIAAKPPRRTPRSAETRIDALISSTVLGSR